jgi:thiol-disulfide isomerase/thioredoxin
MRMPLLIGHAFCALAPLLAACTEATAPTSTVVTAAPAALETECTDTPGELEPMPEPVQQAPTANSDADWNAAMALKGKSDYEGARKLFDAIAAKMPDSPRGQEALVEAGVCQFSHGRSKMKAGFNTPESLAAFQVALQRFDLVLANKKSPVASRAQYMRGSVQLFAGDLSAAEREYTLSYEGWPNDAKYAQKSIERRSFVRRHLLKTDAAIADLDFYLKTWGRGTKTFDEKEWTSVQTHRGFAAFYGKPAPALQSTVWVQGQATSLAQLQGEVVLLYFFATWCDNCERARPQVQELLRRHAGNLRAIGVIDDQRGQTLDMVRAWLPTKGFTLPVMYDVGQVTMRAYQANRIPDMILIDRLGRVRWHDNASNLQDATIEALLVEDPTAGTGK